MCFGGRLVFVGDDFELNGLLEVVIYVFGNSRYVGDGFGVGMWFLKMLMLIWGIFLVLSCY